MRRLAPPAAHALTPAAPLLLAHISAKQVHKAGTDVHYITTGAGSDVRAGEFSAAFDSATGKRLPGAPAELLYAGETQGFTALQLSPGRLAIYFYAAGRPTPAHTVTIDLV